MADTITEVDVTESRLYDLYVIRCNEIKINPTIRNYIRWIYVNYEGKDNG